MAFNAKEYRKKYVEEHRDKINSYHKKSYKKNKLKVNSYQREYSQRLEVKERRRDLLLRWRYGITLAQYNILLEIQCGKCAICGRKRTEGRHLSVDHNHSTGKVRGLLCQNCNHIVGAAYEDIEILKNTIDYLEKHNEVDSDK